MITWSIATALAAEHRVVHPGDTVASLAASLGDASLEAAIRANNGLGSGEEPVPGTIVVFPDGGGSDPQRAVLTASSGRVFVTAPGGGPERAAVGQVLAEGSRVCTDPGAYAVVKLATSPATGLHDDLQLGASTCATVASIVGLGEDRSSHVVLDQGDVSLRSVDAAGAVAIETRDGVTLGDHGGFRVALEPTASRSEAVSGAISLFGAGEKVAVGIGQGARVSAGSAPTAPSDLPQAGAPIAPDDGSPLLRPSFRWQAVDAAAGYRVEVSTADDFSEMVLVEPVEQPSFTPRLLMLPDAPSVWWRVVTVDRLGFASPASDARRLVLPRPTLE
ncbi:MAG: hypothetical protein KC621_08165 [Myxococcales bacterium]|nr:hypothetical protein [Myxococcales bacterium]